MGFSATQLAALKRKLDPRQVRSRETNGRRFSYLEGWHVISEANRIFGYDGWSRETLDPRCALTRETRGQFLAIYIARVRITVKARGATIIREGHGSGEGRGTSPAEVHDRALKAAETDATKRALATFGRPFGLELYRGSTVKLPQSPPLAPASTHPSGDVRSGFHPDDRTPIPRPSRYYGERSGPSMLEAMRQDQKTALAKQPSAPESGSVESAPALPPPSSEVRDTGRIDKSQLMLAEPKRLRDKAHLKFVASQPCLVCGRESCDPHHLRFAQPRAIGMKVSDEFTVPLCRGHHRQLHQAGNEVAWWEKLKIEPLSVARSLWEQTHATAKVAKVV